MSFSMRAVPGKQYGLVQTKKKAPPKPQAALFEEGDSSDEDEAAAAEVERVNRQVAQDRKRKQRKVQQELEKALREDPNAFAYDEHLEGLEGSREKESERKERRRKEERKESKFIGRLMETAKMRERERSKAMEKQIVREIEAEKAVYGDRKAYVTKNYKKHLKEQEQWEADQAKRDAAAAEDVRSKGEDAMGGFYRNLLNTRLAGPAQQAPASAPTAAGHADEAGRRSSERELERKDTPAAAAEGTNAVAAAAARSESRHAAEVAARGSAGGAGGKAAFEEEYREKKRRQEEEEAAQRAAGAKRKREEEKQEREEKIRLARERYLQRAAKRKRTE